MYSTYMHCTVLELSFSRLRVLIPAKVCLGRSSVQFFNPCARLVYAFLSGAVSLAVRVVVRTETARNVFAWELGRTFYLA